MELWSDLISMPFPRGSVVRESSCQCRRGQGCRWDPWVRKTPGGGHGNPLQCSCLENPKDRGAWWATVRGGRKRAGHDWATGHRQTDTWTWGKTTECSLPLSFSPSLLSLPCESTVSRQLPATQEERHPWNPGWDPISDCQHPELGESKFLLFKPSSLCYSVTAARANPSTPGWES